MIDVIKEVELRDYQSRSNDGGPSHKSWYTVCITNKSSSFWLFHFGPYIPPFGLLIQSLVLTLVVSLKKSTLSDKWQPLKTCSYSSSVIPLQGPYYKTNIKWWQGNFDLRFVLERTIHKLYPLLSFHQWRMEGSFYRYYYFILKDTLDRRKYWV